MTTLEEQEQTAKLDQTINPNLQVQPIDQLESYRVIDYNFWRCLRLSQVSGNFYGPINSPTSGNWELDLQC